jgi:hypothetical protein
MVVGEGPAPVAEEGRKHVPGELENRFHVRKVKKLYEEVWSQPVVQVATAYRVSGDSACLHCGLPTRMLPSGEDRAWDARLAR